MSGELQSWEEAVQWLRDQEDQQALVKAAFYDDPLLAAAQRYAESSEWSAVRRFFSEKRGEALDIGAGRGISSYALAGDGWQVTALEPDASNLVGAGAIRALIQESGRHIKVVETWGEKLPFADAAFDLVYCRAVLHHAKDLQDLCKEAYRVLRPGGQFIATREHVISRHEDLDAFLHAHPLHDLYGGEYAYLLNEYMDAIQGAGFQLYQVMNPAASDINLYPQTVQSLKKSMAKKLKLPTCVIPNKLLELHAALSNNPGRLYSFVARK